MTQGWALLPVHLTYITRVHHLVYIVHYLLPHQHNYSYTIQRLDNHHQPVIPAFGFYVINTRHHFYVATRAQLLVCNQNHQSSSHLQGQIHQKYPRIISKSGRPELPL